MENIARIVKELREMAGLSPTELASKSGLSPAYISKLESGEYKSISLKTSKSLAEGLSLTLRDFLTALGMLEDKERPSLHMINHALRSNGYDSEQVTQIIKYAEFIKKTKASNQ